LLQSIIQENPDQYLYEIVQEMEIRSRKCVSIPTLWRSLVYCGITRKKLHKIAKEHNELLRCAYMICIGAQYRCEQLIFLDESSKDEHTIIQRYALTLDSIIAVNIIESSYTKEKFKEFVILQV
ncbi:20659_t:CDS:2, partial [Gigaspora margarita]